MLLKELILILLIRGWDGLGSLVKSHARKQISKNPIRCPIRCPRSFAEETEKHFKNMKVFYCDKDDIQRIYEEHNLQERYDASRTLAGTQRLHHFKCIPGQNTHLKVKAVSTLDDTHYKTMRIL